MQGQYTYLFYIADVTLAITIEHEVIISDRFRPFLVEGKEYDYQAVFLECDTLPYVSGEMVSHNISFDIYQNSDGKSWGIFRDAMREDSPYAVSTYNWEHKMVTVRYLRKKGEIFRRIENCFFHIAWETMITRKGRLILHSSCVDTAFGGILFSGPSGIGKSTQSELWCIHEGAKLLNGDRPILQRRDEQWNAYGSPYAGSSKCHINDRCRVRAIVVLRQGEQCSIRRLYGLEAFRNIFAELTVSTWDFFCVETACTLAEKLVCEVPVYELHATLEQSAVTLLKRVLQEEMLDEH